MITQIANFHLFYPMLFTTIVILIIAVCRTIKYMNGNTTHKGIVENIKDIFFKSSDNAKEVTIDTTSKMTQMHDNVIKVDFTDSHEKELDYLEKGLAKVEKEIRELSQKLDILLERIIKLEEK